MKAENTYAGYGLDENPFAVDETLATIGGQDELTRFRKIICAAEVRRLAKSIAKDLLAGNSQPVWMLEDGESSKQYNSVVTTGVFRYMVAGQDPKILPVYVPLPQVANDFTGNVFKLIIDRLLPRYFRNVIYSFIRRELEAAVADGRAGLSFDAAALLNEIDATAGRTLDEIFFGAEFSLTMAEEYGVVVEPEPEPAPAVETEEDDGPDFVDYDAEDEAAEAAAAAAAAAEEAMVAEEIVEEVTVDARRAPLFAFVGSRLEDESYAAGETVRAAVSTSLADGFVKGRLVLEKTPAPREEIMGLIRLITQYYDGIVVMVDQIDPWPYLTDQERINILSDTYNFELAGAGKALTVMVSDQHNYDDFDAGFKKRCRILPLGLSWTREDSVDFGRDTAKTESLVEDFLNPARINETAGITPFDKTGVAAILEKAGGNILVALEMCRRLVDAGREIGFPKIDKSFANKAV